MPNLNLNQDVEIGNLVEVLFPKPEMQLRYEIEQVKKRYDEIQEQLDRIEKKIDYIFGDHVVIKGRLVNPLNLI